MPHIIKCRGSEALPRHDMLLYYELGVTPRFLRRASNSFLSSQAHTEQAAH